MRRSGRSNASWTSRQFDTTPRSRTSLQYIEEQCDVRDDEKRSGHSEQFLRALRFVDDRSDDERKRTMALSRCVTLKAKTMEIRTERYANGTIFSRGA
jgi:hypothetical protein